MYKVKRLNNVSDLIREKLLPEKFDIIDKGEDYDAVILRSADMHEMQLPESLLAIARAGAGTNNIRIEKCSEKGIVVFNTPGANANAVKELVICGMLLSGRKIVEAIGWLKSEKAAGTKDLAKLVEKAKSNYVGPELIGKKLGVIGLGTIGVMTANTASLGLNMEVLGYDPFISVDAAWRLTSSVKKAKSIDEIYKNCDFISLHLPLNKETRGMIGKDQFKIMKNGAVLLNFARGELVDDEAMLAALDSGKLGRYVTDFPNDVVTGHSGVIAIPHLGASTPESEDNCATMAADQLRDYMLDGNIRNSVNLPDCSLSRSGGVRLTVVSRNITNMIVQMTAVLADSGFNIDNVINKSRGDWAYAIFDLDKVPGTAALDKLRAIDGVQRVRVL